MIPRKITIETMLNGWLVSVGCQKVVFTDLKEMLADLGSYMEDPKDVENRYLELSINSRHFDGQSMVHAEPGFGIAEEAREGFVT